MVFLKYKGGNGGVLCPDRGAASSHIWIQPYPRPHACTFAPLTSPSYLTSYSSGQMQATLLSLRTSSGSKSTQISTPSAPSFPTTLPLPASPNSHSNLARMLAHSSTFSRTASRSSAGSFSLLDPLSKPRQRSPRWTSSAVRAFS